VTTRRSRASAGGDGVVRCDAAPGTTSPHARVVASSAMLGRAVLLRRAGRVLMPRCTRAAGVEHRAEHGEGRAPASGCSATTPASTSLYPARPWSRCAPPDRPVLDRPQVDGRREGVDALARCLQMRQTVRSMQVCRGWWHADDQARLGRHHRSSVQVARRHQSGSRRSARKPVTNWRGGGSSPHHVRPLRAA
jgi:hypothetical protein